MSFMAGDSIALTLSRIGPTTSVVALAEVIDSDRSISVSFGSISDWKTY